MATRLAASVFVLCLTAGATAQLPGPGLSWTGTTSVVRNFLPSCTNLQVTAVRNETVDVRVWGDQMAPFLLLAGPTATQCTPIPGIGNALMLDQPLIVVGVGILTQTTPCLSCPPGYEDTRFVVPPSFPSGGTVSFQAVSFGARNPAFTVAITGTVR